MLSKGEWLNTTKLNTTRKGLIFKKKEVNWYTDIKISPSHTVTKSNFKKLYTI